MKESKHIHMKFIEKFLLLAGIWPLETTGLKLFLYNAYFYATFTFYVLNVSTIYVTAKQVATTGKPTEITNYISNAVFATLLVYRALIYRSSGVKVILKLIKTAEEKILECGDEEVQTIYRKNFESTDFFGKIYVYQGIISSCSAQVFPLICTLMSTPNQDGIKQKYYIVANWVPFDKYEYYYTTYVIQFIFTIYAEMYIIFCGTLFLFILNNIFGQILVLQYKFNNIHEHATAYCKNGRSTFKNACDHFTRQCIMEHQSIISLVQQLDETFQKYIFVDYMCTSFGLSIVVLQFLLEDTLQMRIAAIGFFLVFASQPLIIYYHADLVAIQSSRGLSQAIFESNWYELDLSARKMLQVVIVRAQKPLTLSIGPFKKVGVESLIALIKATYSFLSVMW